MFSIDTYNQGDWILLFAFVIGAGIALFTSIRMFHRARLIEDTPTSKIRSASQGYVELYGTAKWLEGPQIYAPLSGQPCAWYSFTVEKRRDFGKRKWQRINSGVSEELFLLQDDTGTCVIDPEGASVTPSAQETWYGSKPARLGNPSDMNSALTALSNVVSQVGAPYRYTERRLNIEEPIYALGEFKSLGTDYRKELDQSVRDFLNRLKQDKKQLAKYDINQDGTIDQDEWEAARKDAKRAAAEEQLNNPLPKSTHLLKQTNSKTRHPFILSAKSESDLSRNSFIFSIALAIIFVALIAAIFFKLTGIL